MDVNKQRTAAGIVVPYDMALDHEFWRWAPTDLTLCFTRTPYIVPGTGSASILDGVGDLDVLRSAAQDLRLAEPEVVAFGCTSASFYRGLSGEREQREALAEGSGVSSITTSGAVLDAVVALGAKRVTLVTPYAREVTNMLADFLGEAGIEVVGAIEVEHQGAIWKVPYEVTKQAIVSADTPASEAIVVSCTNLPTYDLIAVTERELGKPVITANQATMWSIIGRTTTMVDKPDQMLFDATAGHTVA